MSEAKWRSNVPGIREAGPGDNEAILSFYENAPMSADAIELKSIRKPDFFSFLKLQANDFKVIVHEKDKAIDGLVAVHFREAYDGSGGVMRAGYLGDFRAGFNREMLSAWREVYREILSSFDCRWITAVIDDNSAARNALIHSKKNPFRYDLLTPYTMINVFGPKPFRSFGRKRKSPKQASLKVRRAESADEAALVSFLDREEQKKDFGYRFDASEFQRRLKAWPGFSIRSFIIVFDGDQIVAACAPWSPEGAKSHFIGRMPLHYRFARKMLRLAQIQSITLPEAQALLPLTYLTHLQIDSATNETSRFEIFSALLEFLFEDSALQSRILAFTDYPHLKLEQCAQSIALTASVKMSLYEVSLKTPSNTFEGSTKEKPNFIGFEMALV